MKISEYDEKEQDYLVLGGTVQNLLDRGSTACRDDGILSSPFIPISHETNALPRKKLPHHRRPQPPETSGLFIDQPVGIGTWNGVCGIARDIHRL